MAPSRSSFTDRQTRFSAGELSPSLWARTDLQQYQAGCRTARNFFVGPQGQLVSRPGTMCLGEAVPFEWSGGRSRILPFVFGDSDVLLLRIGLEPGLAVYRWDAAAGRVVPLQITLSYQGIAGWPYLGDYGVTGDSLLHLRCAQVGDVLTLTHPTVGPYELRRLSGDSTQWLMTSINFAGTTYPNMMVEPHVKWNWHLTNTAEAAFPVREWQWAVTKVMERADRTTYETRARVIASMGRHLLDEWKPGRNYGPTAGDEAICRKWVHCNTDNKIWEAADRSGPAETRGPVYPPDDTLGVWVVHDPATKPLSADWPIDYEGAPDEVQIYPEHPAVISWREFLYYPYGDPEDTVKATRVYRGREGRFGYVGQTEGDEFVDDGGDPDFGLSPPTGEYGFSGQVPSQCGFHEGRRIFGGTTEQPGKCWASGVEEYSRFDEHILDVDSGPVSWELSSRRFERVRALFSSRQLLVFTDQTVWGISGSGQMEILSPTSIAARQLVAAGCGDVEPIGMGGAIVFCRPKGPPIAMVNAGGAEWALKDISALWSHLFVGHALVAWAYAEIPWSVLWCVRDDGVLIAFTVNAEHELLAWTRHGSAGGGLAEDVAVLREGTEDAVYLLVRRGGVGMGYGGRCYLEKFASRVVTDIRDAVCLDGSVSVDGRNTNAGKTYELVEEDPDAGIEIAVVGELVDGEDNGRDIRIFADDGTYADVLLSYVAPGQYTGTLHEPVSTNIPATSNWAYIVNVVSGLPVDATEVWALVDGDVVGPFAAAGGVAVLPNGLYGIVVHVGLRYDCDFESLTSPIRGRQQVVKRAWLEYEGRCGGALGQSLAEGDLEQVPNRQVQHGYGPIPVETGELEVSPAGEWGVHGRVAYRQTDPVPITITGLIRELEVGG